MATLFDEFKKQNPSWSPPSAAPAQPSKPKTLYEQYKLENPDNSTKVDISIDPNTRGIKIRAPQYYLDSEEFKTQVLPQFKQLKGKEFTDTDFNTLVNSGMLKDIQQQADDIKQRNDSIQEYKKKFPKASDNDALLFYRNLAAGSRSDSDESTQLVQSVRPDGSPETMSIKDFVGRYKGMSDQEKGRRLKIAKDTINNPDTNETERAIQMSLVQILENKNLVSAKGVTKLMAGMTKFIAESDKSAPGWLYNQTLGRISSGSQTQAQEAREDLAENDAFKLPDVSGAMAVGGGIATIGNIAADYATGGVAGKAAVGAGKAVVGADNATKASKVIDKLADTNPLGNVAATTIKTTPTEVGFALSHAAVDPDTNSVKAFIENTALNAAMFGGAKLAGRTIRAADSASNGAVKNFSENVGRALTRGYDKFLEIPVLGTGIKRFATNFGDENAAIRRTIRSAWADGKMTTEEYYDASNAVHMLNKKGLPQADSFYKNSDGFTRSITTRNELEKAGKEQIELAAKYVNAVSEVSNPRITNARREQLQAFIDEHNTPEFQKFRDDLVAYSKEITDLQVKLGISDGDIIARMEKDPEFAAGYVQLQRDIEPKGAAFRAGSTGSSLKTKKVVQTRRGGDAEALDPFAVANDRVRATFEIAAQDRVNRLIVGLIESGAVNGRVLQRADLVKARRELKFAKAEDKTMVNAVLDSVAKPFATRIDNLADDLEDFWGNGQIMLADELSNFVDDTAQLLTKNDHFKAEFAAAKKLVPDLSERQFALEYMTAHKKAIGARLDKALTSGELGKEQRRNIMKQVDEFVKSELDKEMAITKATTGLTDKQEQIRKLNEQIAPHSALKGEDVIAYFDNGTKGFYQVDDPDLIGYFSRERTPAHDNFLTSLLTNSARLFRLGTTGLNPIFAFVVNPLRDVARATVTAGPLHAPTTYRTLLEATGDPATARRMQQEIDEYIRSATFVENARKPREAIKDAKKIADIAERGRIKSSIVDIFHPKRNTLRGMEDVMNQAEIATRQSVYTGRFQSAMRRGATPEAAHTEALFFAQQATTEFGNTGAMIKSFARTAPYLSAAINGRASFARLAMLDPVGLGIRFTAGVAVPLTYFMVHNLQNEEYANGYFTIPEYERQNSIIVMTGPDSYIKIPLDQQLAPLLAPFKQQVEAHYNVDRKNFQDTVVSNLLGMLSPVDVSALSQENYRGETDYGRAVAQTWSSIMPQFGKPIYEAATGRDIYTGNALGPTDQELIDRGQIAPGQEITDADRTFKGNNSRVLGFIANVIGVPQSTIQNYVKDYTGTVGQFLVNGLDKLSGAPDDQVGGQDIVENTAKRFLGTTGTQVTRDYYAGIDKLEAAKEMLATRLERFDRDIYYTDDADKGKLEDQRQQLIDEYGQQVADFANRFGEYYQRVGGLKPYQLDSLVRLLDLGPSQGAFSQGSYQAGMLQDVRNESRNDAVRRYTDLGLPTSNERDRYGRLLLNKTGDVYGDYSDTSLASQNINSRIYGSPKQLAYEYSRIVRGNKKEGIPSLYEVSQPYRKQIDELYAKAKGLKGKAAVGIYEQISDIQEAYMREQFDVRIKPLLDRYGPEALVNNKEIFKEISSYIMIPGDFKPFVSRNKQPYQKDDVEAYLLDRYGVGKIDRSNQPSDPEIDAIIQRANVDLDSGRSQSAAYRLRRAQERAANGETYINPENMETIKSLISLANKR